MNTTSASGAHKTVKGAARRLEILSAAIDVFAERGYEGASLREIGDRVGISKGNLSYYFVVKDDLLFEIVSDLHNSFLAMTDSWSLSTEPAQDVLRQAARSHVLLVCDKLGATRVSYEDFRYLSPARRRSIIQKRNRYEAAIENLVVRCSPSSDVADYPAITTRVVLGILNWTYQWYSPKGPLDPEGLADLVADMALRSIGVVSLDASATSRR